MQRDAAHLRIASSAAHHSRVFVRPFSNSAICITISQRAKHVPPATFPPPPARCCGHSPSRRSKLSSPLPRLHTCEYAGTRTLTSYTRKRPIRHGLRQTSSCLKVLLVCWSCSSFELISSLRWVSRLLVLGCCYCHASRFQAGARVRGYQKRPLRLTAAPVAMSSFPTQPGRQSIRNSDQLQFASGEVFPSPHQPAA